MGQATSWGFGSCKNRYARAGSQLCGVEFQRLASFKTQSPEILHVIYLQFDVLSLFIASISKKNKHIFVHMLLFFK